MLNKKMITIVSLCKEYEKSVRMHIKMYYECIYHVGIYYVMQYFEIITKMITILHLHVFRSKHFRYIIFCGHLLMLSRRRKTAHK